MKLINKSGDKRLNIIVRKANEMIQNENFAIKMSRYKYFDHRYTSLQVDGAYIVGQLREMPVEIDVFLYTSKNPWTSSNGYTLDNGKTQVFLNSRKLGRSDASIVATLIHECVHEADYHDILFYHHGDNYPKGNSGPEVAAAVAYEVESGIRSTQDSSVENKVNKGVVCYRNPWTLYLTKRCYEIKN